MSRPVVDIADEIRRRSAEAGPESVDDTHDGLALALGQQWQNDARYVAAWNRWLFYVGGIWQTDERLEHMTRTRAFLREIADAVEPKHRKKILSADTVARVVGLARSNVAQAASVELWDADPYMIGHPPEE